MATTLRAFRVDDDLWTLALAASKRRGTDVSAVLRAELERFVQETSELEREES